MGQPLSKDNQSEVSITLPNQGTLRGVTLKNPLTGEPTQHRFTRIPYALPLKGVDRFKLPKEIPNDYDYTGDYKEFGLKCPQPFYESGPLVYPKSPSDEHIQYANIWVPSSSKYKPENGWPVLIYIHGGWLQYGDPNHDYYNCVELMDDANFEEKAIFVTIGYRLNIFGFLSCKELIAENPKNSNMGFWDQREAIKWTYKYISHFGGDPTKITLSGLSAGSYSTFFQLAYELYHPEEEQIIKQVIFFSNMIFSQPKTIEECQEQFDEVIEKLGCSELSSSEKLDRLRSLDHEFIERLLPTLKLHTFRAVTDEYFVSSSVLADIKNGKFVKLLAEKNIRIMHGEVDNESYLYSLLNPPTSIADLKLQIENYYPKKVVPVLIELYNAEKAINLDSADSNEQFANLFGQIIGDGQVYCATRGFINNLMRHGFPSEKYFRYRVSFRPKVVDKQLEPKHKVTHAYDKILWFYTLRLGFSEKEKTDLDLFLKPYLEFLSFKEDISEWETSDFKKFRLFKQDGSIEYVDDPDWDWGVKVADAVYDAQLK